MKENVERAQASLIIWSSSEQNTQLMNLLWNSTAFAKSVRIEALVESIDENARDFYST